MEQLKNTVLAKQKDIREFAGNHDVMTNLKIKKSDVTSSLKDGVLPAGTPISDKGQVDEATTYGLLFNDIDFRGIQEGESVTASVLISGFVNKERVKEYIGKEVPEGVITALKGKVQFL